MEEGRPRFVQHSVHGLYLDHGANLCTRQCQGLAGVSFCTDSNLEEPADALSDNICVMGRFFVDDQWWSEVVNTRGYVQGQWEVYEYFMVSV